MANEFQVTTVCQGRLAAQSVIAMHTTLYIVFYSRRAVLGRVRDIDARVEQEAWFLVVTPLGDTCFLLMLL